MNNNLKISLIVLSILLAALLLVAGGFLLAKTVFVRSAWVSRPYDSGNLQNTPNNGMPLRMQPWSTRNWSTRQAPGGTRQFPMNPGGMHGRFNVPLTDVQPMSMDAARSLFEGYLENMDNDDLYLKEVMLFEQNAYAIVAERSTGMGAMELLADHASATVFPEFGPNRMWNQKYNMMGGARFGFNCGAGFNPAPVEDLDLTMPISQDQARELAQDYLDQRYPGTEASTGVSFYGYYSFDYESDGQPEGMLSVNGLGGAIWEHNWHGRFIQEWEAD